MRQVLSSPPTAEMAVPQALKEPMVCISLVVKPAAAELPALSDWPVVWVSQKTLLREPLTAEPNNPPPTKVAVTAPLA